MFLLDECARLANFPQLEAAITLCERTGLQVWTFWHDLSQLRALYPASWMTLVNSCGTVQVFGTQNYSASAELAALLGIEEADVRSLAADEQIVGRGGALHVIQKLDYATDPLFAGRFDSHSHHTRATRS